jgi:hypothetical protein
MSIRMSSWLRQAAAFLTTGFDLFHVRGHRQRRPNRIAASLSPIFAATESLERRQLLAAADVFVISEADDFGDSEDVPVQVTGWLDSESEESLDSFTTFATFASAANSPPITRPDFVSINWSDRLFDPFIDVLSNDIDIDGTLDPGSIEIVTQPEIGEVEVVGDRIYYIGGGKSSNNEVTFSYRVRDNDAAYSEPAVVYLSTFFDLPLVIDPIGPQSLFVGGGAVEVPLSYKDREGDSGAFFFQVDKSDLFSRIEVVERSTGSQLLMAPGTRPGVARVTVFVADPSGRTAQTTFNVSVGLVIDVGAARASAGLTTHRGYANSVAVPFSTSAAISGVPEGVPASLFRTNVFDNPGGSELLFNIPTFQGQLYDVDLWFAEIWSGAFANGRRVFDVMLEDKLAIDDLDIFKAAGAGNRALTRSFQVVGDGNLSIELRRVLQNPNISGIRVRPAEGPNTPPTISTIADQQTTEDNALTDIEFTIADAETSTLNVSASSADTSLIPNTGLTLFTYGTPHKLWITPAANRSGTTQVTLSVSDGRLTTSTTFTVTVNSVNDFPWTVNDEATTPADTTVNIPVLSNDVDYDSTINAGSVTIQRQSTGGTAVPNADGTISFTPNPGFSGTTTFTYTVRDDLNAVSPAGTVSVFVKANTPPVISAITRKELLPGSTSGPIPFQVLDSDGDNLTVTAVAADSTLVRSVVVTGTGNNRQLSITAGQVFGLTTVTVSVSDGIHAPVIRTIPVSVAGLIDAGTAPPVAGSIADRTFQNGVGQGFGGTSAVKTAPGSLAASVPDLFYRSTLFAAPGGRQLEFDLNATAGQMFAVDLFFAEVWNGAFGQGKRVFDVDIDGKTVLKNFDVFKEAAGGNIGIARRFVIQSDGRIDIDLKRLTQNPMLSGLRITPLGNQSES